MDACQLRALVQLACGEGISRRESKSEKSSNESKRDAGEGGPGPGRGGQGAALPQLQEVMFRKISEK